MLVKPKAKAPAPRRQIEVKQLGIRTGQVVIVTRRQPVRKQIEVKYVPSD